MTDCIFCKIVAKEIPAAVLYEDEKVLAFRDINPLAPFHALIIPKTHIASLASPEADDEACLGALLGIARRLAAEEELSGYRVAINVGKDGGQEVEHLHLHVLGGKPLAHLPDLG